MLGIIILTVKSGILSKEKFRKLSSIITILFESKGKGNASKIKKKTQPFANLPIPDDLHFEIRINPESKTRITVPKKKIFYL